MNEPSVGIAVGLRSWAGPCLKINRAIGTLPVCTLSPHTEATVPKSYPQPVCTASDEMCARGVPFNTYTRSSPRVTPERWPCDQSNGPRVVVLQYPVLREL